jgi:hypothetical protein
VYTFSIKLNSHSRIPVVKFVGCDFEFVWSLLTPPFLKAENGATSSSLFSKLVKTHRQPSVPNPCAHPPRR